MKSSETIWDVVELVADDVGINRERIRLWRFRKRVPYHWRMKIAEAARKHKYALTERDFA